ncbi:hypothetical protein Droror1_Dr00010445 [Drosera rotundifolia]
MMATAVAVEEEGEERWGTWEELVLGGAVMRHGIEDWDAVASEVQARTVYPFVFTPQACKAKYVDLQQHFYGSTAWFDELRKRRVAELKRALEKSEDSIGSLESKLETLKTEKENSDNAEYGSSRSESLPSKDTSKDGFSAGSFTQETETKQAETALVYLSLMKERFMGIDKLAEAIRSEHGVSIKRKRGERKRRFCAKDSSKEGSVGENHLLSSPNGGITTLQSKETLTLNGEAKARIPNDVNAGDRKECASIGGVDELRGILDSLMRNERVSIFRQRRDGQKRARYKKSIRHHIDLDTIRSRIVQRSITSHQELFRDLLLLANNALIFYSKNTREFKCAVLLRDLVTQRLRQYKASCAIEAAAPPSAPSAGVAPATPTKNNPAKAKRGRPLSCLVTTKPVGAKHDVPDKTKGRCKTLGNGTGSPQSMESSVSTKKNDGRRGAKAERTKRGNPGLQGETPMKVRKQARAR